MARQEQKPKQTPGEGSPAGAGSGSSSLTPDQLAGAVLRPGSLHPRTQAETKLPSKLAVELLDLRDRGQPEEEFWEDAAKLFIGGELPDGMRESIELHVTRMLALQRYADDNGRG